MTLVLTNGTRTELVQCDDCGEYAVQHDAGHLGWSVSTHGDWKCDGCLSPEHFRF